MYGTFQWDSKQKQFFHSIGCYVNTGTEGRAFPWQTWMYGEIIADSVTLEEAISILATETNRIYDLEPEAVKVCGHVGYPFGEPPIMACELSDRHEGDHQSTYEGKQFKHGDIADNRKRVGL